MKDQGGISARERILQDSASNIFTTIGSETYQLLKTAQAQKLAVKATYHEKVREFSVIQLGWTERRERCFVHQQIPEEGCAVWMWTRLRTPAFPISRLVRRRRTSPV